MTAATTKTVRIRIERCDGPQEPSYWEEFEVPHHPSTNVISALQSVAANPKTVNGDQSQPVVYDAGCLEEVCGACTMVINGVVRQACSALVHQLLEETDGGPITLQPMAKFPVVRDLMVNRQRMFDNLRKIKGWVPIDGTGALGPGPRESPEKQQLRYDLSRCMTCGCCLEACPEFTRDNDFVGAQIFGQVLYFNEHETGKRLKGHRLDVMMEPGGITDCGNAQNCVKVCPKDIPLTEAIAHVGRQATVHGIKRFFTARNEKAKK